jgi:hypothetical protein
MKMAESTERHHKPFEGVISEEARAHAHAAREEMRKTFEALFPPEFAEHRHQAHKEFLLAARAMIDASLKRMEEKKKA